QLCHIFVSDPHICRVIALREHAHRQLQRIHPVLERQAWCRQTFTEGGPRGWYIPGDDRQLARRIELNTAEERRGNLRDPTIGSFAQHRTLLRLPYTPGLAIDRIN